ncbi:RDD family protein [Actinomycetes bacterium KLBMP 9797]
MSADTDIRYEPASLGRRFGALVVDWVLCLLVSNFFGDPVRDGWPPVAVLIAEYAFFIGLFAQTPGMAVTRVRCVSFADGGRIGIVRALVRGVLLALVVPALIMDDRRRGLHDKAAGSIVVSAAPS